MTTILQVILAIGGYGAICYVLRGQPLWKVWVVWAIGYTVGFIIALT